MRNKYGLDIEATKDSKNLFWITILFSASSNALTEHKRSKEVVLSLSHVIAYAHYQMEVLMSIKVSKTQSKKETNISKSK